MSPASATASAALPSLEALGPQAVQGGVLVVAAVVYLGMFLGGLPRLKLDRAGVALLGAIAMIAVTGMSIEQAARAVDLPTVVLLFAFMVVSAQMRLGGFYTAVTLRVGTLQLSPRGLLAMLLAVAAALSAVFSNDIVCLAMTPVVARICLTRGLNPLPFLLGLACAANIGSAATLIGNPQNMLIGSMLRLSFAGYLAAAWLPVVVSLVALWAWLALGPGSARLTATTPPSSATVAADDLPPYDHLQTVKGVAVSGVLLVVFLASGWPRELAALVGAGVLLLSRRLHSSHVMGFVDWQLLLLFIGLFIVNQALQDTGASAQAVAWLAGQGVHLERPGPLLVVGAVLSNLVSNVPAVMLLLPHLKDAPPDAGVLLALASTFAGNLLLVGSIANLIVADLAEKAGIPIDWRSHARVGVPVTLWSMVLLAAYWALWRGW